MEGVLDFTNDLVECVNNDTKELIIGRNTEQLFVLPTFKVKKKVPRTGFMKFQNGLKWRETPPSNTIFGGNDANCPSIKSISYDLNVFGDFNYWKLEPMYSGEDIELESINEEEAENSKLSSSLLFENNSLFLDKKDSTNSIMTLLLASKEKLSKLKSPSILPKSSLDVDVIFVPPGQEKDVLTNWNVWDKFGETWDDEYKDSGDDDEDGVKISEKHKDINIQEVFWSISLSLCLSRKEPSLLNMIRNLPVGDSPDIFLNSSDKVTIKKQTKDTAKDPINIFKSIRHIFNESTKNIRQTKYSYYPKSMTSDADNITNWNNSHKFGQQWDSAKVEDKGDTALENKYVCIVNVFWKICLDEKLSRREPCHSNIMFNLPVRDWPDVMTDKWEMSAAGIGKFSKKTQKDPVTIFKSFRHIFCEPETEDWIHIEKTGNQWEFPVEHEETLEYVSKKRKDTTSDVDVMEVFWKISLDENFCIENMKHSVITKHFPAWFGPDVFEDSWDFSDFSDSFDNKVLNENTNKPKDPVNIFKSCRRVFFELLNYQKKEKVEIMLNQNISEEEDIFQDQFVNVLNANNRKRNMQPDKTYLSKMKPTIEKKMRSDPDVDMGRQEQELLTLLENWRI